MTSISTTRVRGAIVLGLIAILCFALTPATLLGDSNGAEPPWEATNPPPDSTKGGDTLGTTMDPMTVQTDDSDIGLIDMVETLIIVL
ncbi:hypothetical protein GF377_05620 [candidate division GN15 bacterium]|nr:hypothetical protein [candidate division GN15 bacterium]